MLIHNKGNFARTANGVTVIPGANQLSDTDFRAFTKHPIIQKLVETREIDIPAGQVQSLAELNADEAISLVKDTYAAEYLEQFKAGETRKTVLAAIDEQLNTLK